MESAKPSPLRPLSLNSAGPRSLQLRSNPSPASPSAAGSPSRPSHLKRASTVSYSPRSPSTCVPQSPARDRPLSSGANSTPQSRRASLRAARRTSYDSSLAPDPMLSSPLTSSPITAAYPAEQPLTLVERNAELLQKIAAKEAICLDLRAQLAAQEEDLRALKAEWNSILNRDAPQLITGSSSSTNVLSQGKDFVNGLLAIANAAGSGSSVSPRNSLLFPLVPSPLEGEPAGSAPILAPSKGHLAHARDSSATPSDSSQSSSVSGSSLARNSISSMSSITEEPNRHTQHVINLPGPSSIPLAPISAWTAAIPSLDSLPGTFNKKWEEIQKNETLSKSSKRASLIISDVSKSFLDTFAGPAPQPVRPGKPVLKSTVSASTPTTQKSLLDGDDDEDGDGGFGPLVSAAPAEGDRLGRALVPTPVSTSVVSKKSKKAAEDEEEDWNW